MKFRTKAAIFLSLLGLLIYISIFTFFSSTSDQEVMEKNVETNSANFSVSMELEGSPKLGEEAVILVKVVKGPVTGPHYLDLEFLGKDSPNLQLIPRRDVFIQTKNPEEIISYKTNLTYPGIWSIGYHTYTESPYGRDYFKSGEVYLIVGENGSTLTESFPEEIFSKSTYPSRYLDEINYFVNINSFIYDNKTKSLELNVTHQFSWPNRKNLPYVDLKIKTPVFDAFSFKSSDTDHGGNASEVPKTAPRGRYYGNELVTIQGETKKEILAPGWEITFNYVYDLSNLSYVEYRQNSKKVWEVYGVETEPRKNYNIVFRADLNISYPLIIPGYYNGKFVSQKIFVYPYNPIYPPVGINLKVTTK